MGEHVDRTRPRGQAGNGRAGNGHASPPTLEALSRVAGEAPASVREPGRDEAGSRQPEVAERPPGTQPEGPPWRAVIATTMRLWLRRQSSRLGRLPGRRWVIVLAALAIALLAVGALTVFLARHAVTTTAQAARHTAPGTNPRSGPGRQHPGALPASQAAVWVARQVSRDAIVACDPSMCPALRARGVPAANLLALQSGATDPLFSDVIVATQAVRSLFGSRLQIVSAPAVMASFGSGATRIDVRAIAPEGAAAYEAALSSDWAARRTAAAELVRNPGVRAAGAARQELLTGQVDSRLLITLAALAVSHSVNVVAFGGSAPGVAAGVPLREMEISGTGSPAYHSAELQRIRSFVLAQHPAFLPAQVRIVRAASGGIALRIEFGAPSPLGLLLGSPVTQ